MKKFDQINVIPFIDIMLVLLAIVLLTASFSKNGKIDVSLPAADNAEEVATDSLPRIISVSENGQLYLDDSESNLDSIEKNMADWPKDQPILLKIDRNASFDFFVQLSSRLKEYDLKNISVLTENH
ncbi:TonB system transport protein ExbD [Suttonella indologenes]|uniref:Biopolymer transport protein ExbD n=1 Tax=Suttonella indologenes TaxID=13276 RepID=A0A380MKG6_9GAMM|nr:TonB system transport protein ExbD [Suttonella indologenes]SUO92413.1 biopolymer transport protein ExbD [Suttonella indologenes]